MSAPLLFQFCQESAARVFRLQTGTALFQFQRDRILPLRGKSPRLDGSPRNDSPYELRGLRGVAGLFFRSFGEIEFDSFLSISVAAAARDPWPMVVVGVASPASSPQSPRDGQKASRPQ
jgi:hypothetical protein